MTDKAKRAKFFAFLLLFLSVVVWFSLGRQETIEVHFSQNKLSLWEGEKLLAEVENKENSFTKLLLEVNHDKDSLAVLPVRHETITLTSSGQNSRVFPLSRPVMTDYFQEIESSLSFSRPPFAARVLYHDDTLPTKTEIPLDNISINKITLRLWNATEVKFTLQTKDEENIKLWFRPKFHHDASLTVNDVPVSFKTQVNNSSFYYLQILISLLLRNLIGAGLIVVCSIVLTRIFPKKLPLISPLRLPWDRIFIIVLPIVTFIATSLVAKYIHEEIPHSQDEVVYLFQAKIFAQGKLYLSSAPGELRRFFDHEFIINNGKWFAIYPPGNSLFLAIGILNGKPELLNPIISAINIFLIILIARKFIPPVKTSLTVLLLMISPFYLLVSSSFLNHPIALFSTLLTFIAFIHLRQDDSKKTRFWLLLGGSLGMLYLVRPINAIVFGIFIGVYLIKKIVKCFRQVLYGAICLLIFLTINATYNFLLTGNPFLPPLNLYSPYVTLGFGLRGVEWGNLFTVNDALKNLTFNTLSLLDMLFRWPTFLTLAFIPFAFIGKYRKQAIFLSSFFLIQASVYFCYFYEGTFYGPRFWFEVAWILPLLTVMGIESLGQILDKRQKHVLSPIYLILTILFFYGLISTLKVLPQFKDFNGMSPVAIPSLKTPAVVFIPSEGGWIQYGRFFYKMHDPLNDPVIFVRDQAIHNVASDLKPLANESLKSLFPNRHLYLLKENQYIEMKNQ